jgi:hypothetical protein
LLEDPTIASLFLGGHLAQAAPDPAVEGSAAR